MPDATEAAQAVVSPEIEAAVAAGDVEGVKKLLAAAPELSKSQIKKLNKNAEIAAKKLTKGGGAAAAKPAAAKRDHHAPSDKGGEAAKSGGAAAAAATASAATGGNVVKASEAALITDLLACIATLELPADAMAKLRSNEAALAGAMKARLGAMQNAAYSAGFAAKA